MTLEIIAIAFACLCVGLVVTIIGLALWMPWGEERDRAGKK